MGRLYLIIGVTALSICLVIYVMESQTPLKSMEVVFQTEATTSERAIPSDILYCYKMRSDLESLPDIATANPPKDRSIFFLETTCKSHEMGKITIQKRQACAVESAALMNPNHTVFLLFASPGKIKPENKTESDRILAALTSYRNVNLRYMNFSNYVKGSPAEKVFDKVRTSQYAQSHASDMLRFLTMSKYGGIYLDLDVVVLKSLEKLASTFAGFESEAYIGSAILRFDSSGIGHGYAEKCLEDFSLNYRPSEWGYNGPGVLTRLAEKLCNVKELKTAFNKDCAGFTFYSPNYFFPIFYGNWKRYFQEEFGDEVMTATRDSYVVHIWNKLSEDNAIRLTSNASYIKLARKFCPKVYAQCDEFF